MSVQKVERNNGASKDARSSGGRTRHAADSWFDRLAPVMFGLFMASLVSLLVLIYAGVPLV